MKKYLYHLFFLSTMIIAIPGFSEKVVVIVEPDEGVNIGALNQAIENDVDPGNTIFELRRDGVYYLNGTIAYTDFTLHIRAEEGTGAKPVLQPAVDEQGNVGRHFSASGNLILEGVYLQGRSELGSIIDQPVRVTGDGVRVIIDDSFFDYCTSSMVRLNADNSKVYITNSIFRNALLSDNPDNGRLVDTRSNPTDTISVKNSTIYNGGSRLIRTSGANINYMEMDHNTVFQTSFKENFMLDATKTAKITNNIFYNFSYRVDNTQHDPMFTVDSIGEGGPYLDEDRYFDLSNNNIYQQQEIIDVFDNFSPDTLYRFNDWDTLQLDTIYFEWDVNTDQLFANQNILDTATWTPKPVLLHFIENGQVDTTNIFNEELEFDNAPPLNLDYLEFYVSNNFSIGGTNPPNPFADEDPNAIGEVEDGYTFRYNANSISATAATGGNPLGDPRWTPIGSNVNDITREKEMIVYPNPSSGMVTVEFLSPANNNVRIEVINITGQLVYATERETSAGNSQLLDLQNMDKGIYFLVVHYDNNKKTTRLIIQ